MTAGTELTRAHGRHGPGAMKQAIRRGSIAISLLIAVALAACTTSRGILDVRVPDVANPSSGIAVRIASVTDSRHFERRPRQPSVPSLKHGHIEDPDLTSRAIARKRNGYGKAQGDVLLPEGRTVAEVASAAVTAGLRRAGYRVMEKGQPGYDAAAPLSVDVQQFWAWFTPGFFAFHLSFEAQVAIQGPVGPFREGAQFRSALRRSTQAATGRAWRRVIDEGVADLADQVGAGLARDSVPGTPPPSGAPGAYPASPARP